MAKYPIKLLKDESNTPFVPLVSTDCIRDKDNQTLQEILNKKLSPTNLLGGEYVNITTEGSNCYINVDLPANLNIINNLTTDSAGQGALDAYQGYVLNQKFGDYVLTAALENLVKRYILASHPVGSIEINITGTNPSTYLGGTWVAWGTGRVPVGIDIGDTDFSTVEKTGGSKTHTHTYSHTHNVPGVAHTHSTGNHTLTVDEMPSHNHRVYRGTDGSSYFGLTGKEPDGNTPYPVETTAVGGSQSHNHGNTGSTTPSATTTNSQSATNTSSASNVQPYITCYMWKRTA